MNKRHHRHIKRRFIIREQLTAYGVQLTYEIPYHEQYLQFMVKERGCQASTATNNLKIIRQFARFLKQEYGMDSFEPTEVTPRHIRRYLTYLKNERGNRPSTRNTKLAALGSYYLFLECYEYIKEEDNPTLLIKRARVPRRLPIFLTADEAKDLLIASTGVAEPERNLAIMRIMIQAGLRVQEIINLSNSPSFASHLFDSPITGRRGPDGLKKTGRSCNIKDNPVIPACNSRPVKKCYEEASVSVIL